LLGDFERVNDSFRLMSLETRLLGREADQNKVKFISLIILKDARTRLNKKPRKNVMELRSTPTYSLT